MDAETKNTTAQTWRERIVAQQASGRPIRSWCRDNRCHEHSFYWWRRQFGPASEKPIRFALVETTPASEMHRPGQARLELFLTSGECLIPADEATLRLVLSAVREQK